MRNLYAYLWSAYQISRLKLRWFVVIRPTPKRMRPPSCLTQNRNVASTEGAYFSSDCYHITLRSGIAIDVCETLDCRCGNTGSYHCVLRKIGGERLWKQLTWIPFLSRGEITPLLFVSYLLTNLGCALNTSLFKVPVPYSRQVSELLMVLLSGSGVSLVPSFSELHALMRSSLHVRKLSALRVFICHFPLLPSNIRS